MTSMIRSGGAAVPQALTTAFVRSSSGYAAGAAAFVGLPTAVLLDTDAEAATAAAKTVKNRRPTCRRAL